MSQTIGSEMPDFMPGAHGRNLRVVRAILREIEGRSGWEVVCGNAWRGCREVLGYPADHAVTLDRHMPGSRKFAGNPGVWCLTHSEGYRGRPATGYFILSSDGRRSRDGRRIGARPLPRAMDPMSDIDDMDIGLKTEPGKRRGLVGQFPIVPCIVFCNSRSCGAPNWVEPPPVNLPIPTRTMLGY